jgi:O-acetylserine/cysteine efflux transporter
VEYSFYGGNAGRPGSNARIAGVPARLSPRDLALVLVVVSVWGFNFVPIRWALDSVPPFALAALRFLFAAIPAVLFVKRPDVSWGVLAAYGLAIGVFQFGFLVLGMRLGMPAGLSSLVIQVQVFFTIGLAAWWLHDRLSLHSLVGAAIALAGIVVLAAHKVTAGAGPTLIGFALVIAAALSWGIGNVIVKRAAGRSDLDMLGVVVWASLVAPVPLAVASFAFEGGPDAWNAAAHMGWLPLACVLFMSYFATLFCYARWNALLHAYPTSVIAPFALLVPVSGLVSGAVFLNEALAPLQAAGAALVLAGLTWNLYGAQAREWLVRTLD